MDGDAVFRVRGNWTQRWDGLRKGTAGDRCKYALYEPRSEVRKDSLNGFVSIVMLTIESQESKALG
jgi:hypothetical protein